MEELSKFRTLTSIDFNEWINLTLKSLPLKLKELKCNYLNCATSVFPSGCWNKVISDTKKKILTETKKAAVRPLKAHLLLNNTTVRFHCQLLFFLLKLLYFTTRLAIIYLINTSWTQNKMRKLSFRAAFLQANPISQK